MLRSGWKSLCRWTLAAAVALACAAPTLAADDEDTGPFREPGLSYRSADPYKPYIDWGFAALLIAAAAIIAFKNPHRSHLD
ncbi:MAG: hypothetical protein IPM13_15655 [Phycisphaerales bacterium]|nr:hypothetical protein [Phycisphaerales bacterium]